MKKYDMLKDCPEWLKDAIKNNYGVMCKVWNDNKDESRNVIITEYRYYNIYGNEGEYKYSNCNYKYIHAEPIEEPKIKKGEMCAFFDKSYLYFKIIKYHTKGTFGHYCSNNSFWDYAIPVKACREYLHLPLSEWPKEFLKEWDVE